MAGADKVRIDTPGELDYVGRAVLTTSRFIWTNEDVCGAVRPRRPVELRQSRSAAHRIGRGAD
jgi:hypothetical protein